MKTKIPMVFDVYGTLLDVDAAARRVAAEPGMEQLAECWPKLAAAWRQRQLSLSWLRSMMGQYCDFWTITVDALDASLAELGLDDPNLRWRLLSLYTKLDCYPEVTAVLAELAETGMPLVVLSNGNPQMLETALHAAAIDRFFDAVLSADECGVYKPDAAVYSLVTERYECEPAAAVFFSANDWDIAGAGSFGFRTVWVNRSGGIAIPLPTPPAVVINTLAEAPELLAKSG